MIGAIVGDIVGSRFEFRNIKTKDFDLFTKQCDITDDSIMTLAVAQALVDCGADAAKLPEAAIVRMQEFGHRYPAPQGGYGGRFGSWLFSDNPKPYNSWGNGAAMRVSACAYAGTNLTDALRLSEAVTAVTHNHEEGIKGAEATTCATYMALHGSSIQDIYNHINRNYYPMDFTLDEIRPTYRFTESSQGTVPQAIMAFLESESFEDAIRNAISIGGDSDTIGAITGAIAGAFYGVPKAIRDKACGYMDDFLLKTLRTFERTYIKS